MGPSEEYLKKEFACLKESKKENIIFLDWDGVMSDLDSRIDDTFDLSDDVEDMFSQALPNIYSIKALNTILNCVDAKVVMLCRWAGSHTKAQWEEGFKEFGLNIQLHDDWIAEFDNNCVAGYNRDDFVFNSIAYTTKDPMVMQDYIISKRMGKSHPLENMFLDTPTSSDSRGYKVISWLKKNGCTSLVASPEFNYVILDDEEKLFPVNKSFLYHLKDGEKTGGLKYNDVYHVLSMFKRFA